MKTIYTFAATTIASCLFLVGCDRPGGTAGAGNADPAVHNNSYSNGGAHNKAMENGAVANSPNDSARTASQQVRPDGMVTPQQCHPQCPAADNKRAT